MSGWFKGFTTTRTRVSPDMSSSSQLPQLFVTITVSQTGIKKTKKRVFLTAAVMFFFLFGVYIWEEKKTPRWRSTNRSCGPYPYFQGHNPPPAHFSDPFCPGCSSCSHIVSSSLRTGNGCSSRIQKQRGAGRK